LERIDVSIIFEPTLTTRPPMRLSSTVALIVTVLPIDAVSFDGADLVFGQSAPDEDE
jgi:hypothetical protein